MWTEEDWINLISSKSDDVTKKENKNLTESSDFLDRRDTDNVSMNN